MFFNMKIYKLCKNLKCDFISLRFRLFQTSNDFVKSKGNEELCKIVYDLHPAEDGEASEEPHGASDEPQRRLGRHLLVFLYFRFSFWRSIHLLNIIRKIISQLNIK